MVLSRRLSEQLMTTAVCEESSSVSIILIRQIDRREIIHNVAFYTRLLKHSPTVKIKACAYNLKKPLL
jgi:hypothetical protein